MQGRAMEKTWVLIANAARAKCFERHGRDHSLTELADFVHPHVPLSKKTGKGDLTGAAGKGHGRTAHAGTQFEPLPSGEHTLTAAGRRPQPFRCAHGGYDGGGSAFSRQ